MSTSKVIQKNDYPTYVTTVPHTVFVATEIVKGTTTVQVPERWSLIVQTTDSQGHTTTQEIFVSRDTWFSYSVGQPYTSNINNYN